MTTLATGRVRRISLPVGLSVLALICCAVIIVSFGVGPIRVPTGQVWSIVLERFGVGHSTASQLNESVVRDLRMPRVLFGALAGAALAASGAALQSLFNNPLADPGIIGVSNGASMGAVLAIVALPAGLGGARQWLIPLGAFVGGLAVTALIYALARPGAATGTARLLLVGIAVGAGCAAVTGYLTYASDDSELAELVFWQMGSLANIDWAKLAAGALPIVLGLLVLLLIHRRLDLLTLGERQAQHLGLHVQRNRLIVIVATALLTGAAVAFAGTISFVGLVVPHIVRMIFGPRHKAVLPASMLFGAILLVLADTGARTLAPPAEIPIGLFTAALGAPFFLMIVLRSRQSGAS